ncbi:MAG: D-alanine--D-alanine ligase [Desulfobacterales bacterium]|nr:D-alanine--D-alanine ligase [Desulfobacterales bacterium]
MIIGITYDLRSEYLAAGYTEEQTAEFDKDDTIVSLETALQQLGHQPIRIGNAFQLIKHLMQHERWDLVFNIAEGLNGIGREAQIPSILDLYGIPYTFSDPLVMSLTLHKGLTKRVIRDAGLPTANFMVIERIEKLTDIPFSPPYFVKPIAEGTGKGIAPDSIAHNQKELIAVCQTRLDKYQQPVLVEQFLSGREFTVGIWGTGDQASIIGTIEVILLTHAEPEVYSYINKERCEELVEYKYISSEKDPIVKQAETIALDAWKVLGCRDAGRIDIRCDAAGHPFFLEVNPLAGLHPEHSDLPIICNKLGIPYIDLIRTIVDSASQRMNQHVFKPKTG